MNINANSNVSPQKIRLLSAKYFNYILNFPDLTRQRMCSLKVTQLLSMKIMRKVSLTKMPLLQLANIILRKRIRNKRILNKIKIKYLMNYLKAISFLKDIIWIKIIRLLNCFSYAYHYIKYSL
jgi:hypothetical protein